MDNLTALLLNNYINGGGGSGGGLPSGGTDGQIIRKDTSAQEGAVWQNVDAAPTENSTNLVESGGVRRALAGKTGIDLGISNASVGEVATVASVDENGKPTAWTALKTDVWEELLSVTLEEDTSNISYIEETGNFNKRYKQLAIFVQLVGTVTIYPQIGFCNGSGNISGGWGQSFYDCQNGNYGAIKSSDSTRHAFLIDVLSNASGTPVITRKINGVYGNSEYPSSIFGTSTTCITNETVAGLTYGFSIIAKTNQSAFLAGSKIKMYGVKR